MSNKQRVILKHRNELKAFLEKKNAAYQPSYMHDDYITTSLSLPYPTKDKLDRLAKQYKITRSGLIALLIESM